MALIKQLLYEILSKYALRKCVYRPIVLLRLDSIIPFFLVFLSTSALPANSSLELNIQLVPHMSQDPTQLIMRPSNTSVRMHISIYFFAFSQIRTLHSAVPRSSSIIVNNARCLDAMHCRSPTSLRFYFFIGSIYSDQ